LYVVQGAKVFVANGSAMGQATASCTGANDIALSVGCFCVQQQGMALLGSGTDNTPGQTALGTCFASNFNGTGTGWVQASVTCIAVP